LPRWRSPELAAGCWGGSAATVAPGPQGATYAPYCRGGQLPQDRGQRAPGSGGRTDRLRPEPRRAGRGGRCQRDGDGRRGGIGRDPCARVAAAAWPQGEPAPGIAFDDIGTPTRSTRSKPCWTWTAPRRTPDVILIRSSRNLSQSGAPPRVSSVRRNLCINRVLFDFMRRSEDKV
jgi:hypothetical protein